MKHRKALLCLLLTAILSLTLAACGGGAAGKDWRTDGTVIDHITLQHEGESLPLCVCIDTKGVALYHNKDERKLFARLTFPTVLEDAAEDYAYTTCSDDNGNGESDIEIHFSHGDMSESRLLWSWVDGEGYVYQPSFSYLYRNGVLYAPTTEALEDGQAEIG